MKKNLLFSLMVLVIGINACSDKAAEKEEKSISVCDCVKAYNEMTSELKADGSNSGEIEDKYKDKIEACKKLGEGKSDEEKKQMAEEARNCD